jgi:hypothetical protein
MGFAPTTVVAGVLAIAVVVPRALVLRACPQDIGLSPDGVPLGRVVTAIGTPNWTRRTALRTPALRHRHDGAVQIGFLTHQITLLAQSVDPLAVSMTVSPTAFAALVGRLALARFADEIDARVTTFSLFWSPLICE